MPLPPRCPQLNPAENVWRFIHDNWLSNKVFETYDNILDQPWRSMTLGLRDWAHPP